MPDVPRIRAITFDFWRTLFRDANSESRQRVRLDAFTSATGLPEPDVRRAMELSWREFDRCHREEQRTLEPKDAVRLMAQTLRADVDDTVAHNLAEVFATAILEHSPEPIPGALEAVCAAAERVPVGVISDSGVSPGRCLRALLERHGFMRHIQVLVFSDVVRVSKPQRPMFETAAKGLCVRLDELLHIGDLEYSDVLGAKAVGAKAALFTGDNPRYAAATTADYVYGTWPEFIADLDALCDGLERRM